MFYCGECAAKSKWPESISKSFGKCECCGNHTDCNDRPSSSLPIAERSINNKLDELISKFKNGEERYRNSALMNKCVQTLARDGDPIELIDQLVEFLDSQNKQLEEMIKNYGAK